MLPVSSAFQAAIRSSHEAVSRVRVITPGATGADPPGTDLAVVEGTVTLDGTADVRGTLDLTVTAAWPTTATTADLVPYGTELAVSRGVVFGNGDIQRAPLGVYRITLAEQPDAPKGPLRITASDRMSGLIDAELLAPRQFLATATYGTVVSTLVTEVYPAAVIEWDDATSAVAIGRPAVVELDRYAFLADLVKALGKVWYYDYRGVLVIRDPPDPGTVVWEVNAGADGVLVSVGRSRSREGVRNAVVATGEAIDDVAPVSATVVDSNPSSVTYWDGPFGKVPERYSSPLLVTTAQALKAATTRLSHVKGLPYRVDFTAVPNPALEPGDVVAVSYPPVLGRAPAVQREVHVVDRLTIGLGAGALTASTRLQSTGGLG